MRNAIMKFATKLKQSDFLLYEQRIPVALMKALKKSVMEKQINAEIDVTMRLLATFVCPEVFGLSPGSEKIVSPQNKKQEYRLPVS